VITVFEFEPKQRVEWRNGSGGDISRGTLIEPDNEFGGPWWLVDVDGEEKQSLVKTYALYPEGGIRREQMADAIHRVMREKARQRTGRPYDACWSDALACADAVIALDAEAGEVR
jgi:hypothetical protein